MDVHKIGENVDEKIVAAYKNSLYVNGLLDRYLAGDDNVLNEYGFELQKAIKKNQAWLDEKMYSFELAFEKKHPKETIILNKQAHFVSFVSGVFNGFHLEKDTIGEIEIYYALETNAESQYIGFYLLLSLYGYSGCRHVFVIAKSKNGCEDFFPLTIDQNNRTFVNELLTVEIEKTEAFTEIISACEEATTFVNEKIGEKLIRNY